MAYSPSRIVLAAMDMIKLKIVIGIGAIVYQVKLVQWRREYERSVNRLIRTIYRGA